ncbi:MAG: HDIG domain-containing protein [Myxococcota bacterium]|nr:HDIG domain-containing protein [Myxococcota bacterium]
MSDGSRPDTAPQTNRGPIPSLQRLITLLLVSLGSALLLMDFARDPGGELTVGAVADHDIRAYTSFQFVDWEATLSSRRKAEHNVLPVYDYDVSLVNRMQARTSDAFDSVRRRHQEALLGAKAEGRTGLSPEEVSEIQKDFLKLLDLSLDSGTLDLLAAAQWSPALERTANDLIGVALRRYIVADRSLLPTPTRSIAVLRILLDGQDELQLDDYEQILSPEEARNSVSITQLEHPDAAAHPDRVRGASALARAAVRPNLSYNQLITEERRRVAQDSVAEVVHQIQRGMILVRKGDVVTQAQVERVQAQYRSQGGQDWRATLLALAALCALILGAVYQFAAGYIRKFSTRIRDVEAMAFLLLLIILMARLTVELAPLVEGAIGRNMSSSSMWFLVPLAGTAMAVRILINSETALVFVLASSSLVGLMMDQQVLMVIFFVVSGVSASAGVAHTRERVNVLRGGLQAGVVNATAALLINLVQTHLGDGAPGVVGSVLPLWDMGFALMGGILSAFLVLGLVPIFELLGFVTDYKLLELSNHNHPLLRNLMVRAPGTYHHSVIVGSLAEAAAEAIHCNVLLTRVSCYFHDIGKSIKPHYFIENQRDGVNPHDRLDPRGSAQRIIEHVIHGAELARRYKLPKPVVDSIYMHHGTGLIQYFYARAIEEAGPGEKVDPQDFRYPGPRPNSRETGIICLADKVEAACRSIKDPTPEKLRDMIQHLVNLTIEDGQLEECPITLKELYAIVETFTDVLLGIYHHRIEYPGLPANKRLGEDVPRSAIITLEVPNPLMVANSDDEPNRQ